MSGWMHPQGQQSCLRSAAAERVCKACTQRPDTAETLRVSQQNAYMTDEVLGEVHYIEMQLGSGDPGGQNPACFALIAGMSGIEALTENYYNPLELKLNGLGQTTRDNISKFEPLLDEMMIKHGHNMVMSVEWRLALVIGTTVLTVHAANSGMQFPGNIQAASSISAKEAKGSYDEL